MASVAQITTGELEKDILEICRPMQEPLANRAQGEWWAEMPEAFHLP
jgi:L-rhamnose mutarotase